MQTENQSATGITAEAVKRTVTIVTTKGEKKKVEFEGVHWNELKSKLSGQGYDLNNMKAVESIGRTTLEHDTAIVPAKDFVLFLMPYVSKSGTAKKVPASGTIATKKAPAKKVAEKKAAPKKAAAKAEPKKVAPKKAKAIADVIKSVEVAKIPEKTDAELNAELRELASGFKNVRI